VIAVAVLIVIVVLERSVTGGIVGLLGGLVGALIGFAVLQAGLLVGAVALRARVRRIVVGVGPRIGQWRLGTRSVALRAVPVMLSVAVGPGRAPVRPRLWGASMVSAVSGVTVAVGLAILGSGALWHGAAVGCTAAVILVLLPRRDAAVTSTGWILVNYPRLTGREAAELDASALVAEVSDAVHVGDLAAAERIAERLATDHAALRSATLARVVVLEANGRYAEAMRLVLDLLRDPEIEQLDFTTTMAGLAGLSAAAVEAGQLDGELGLPAAERAIADAERLNYPSHRLTGTKALVRLLRGDTDGAITLATTATGLGEDTVSRADDLATLARAYMAAGDNVRAREVLGAAERLAPWWPRVAGTRARLDLD